MFDKIFNSTKYLERGLDASVMRGQVIANNIANAETPGFKSSSVDFETYFLDALKNQSSFDTKTTRDKHIKFTTTAEDVQPTVRLNSTTNMRMDDNNVDIDYQNAQLAKNQIYFYTVSQKLTSEFTKLRMAIREGN